MVPPATRPLHLSAHWIEIQQNHIDHEDEISSKKFTGQCWLQKVLNAIIISGRICTWPGNSATPDLHGIDASRPQEAKCKAKLKPGAVALYKTAKKLKYLDKRLFRSARPTQTEAPGTNQGGHADRLISKGRSIQPNPKDPTRDIREFFVRPASQTVLPRPPAVQISGKPIPRLRDG